MIRDASRSHNPATALVVPLWWTDSEQPVLHQVRPDEPWLCFRGDPQKERVWGFGYGVASTAFNDDSNIQDVGRGELRL